MDCGADLAVLRDEKSIKIEAPTGTREASKDVAPVGAGHGTAAPDEKSEKTRIRTYDRQYAGQLASERITAVATALIALVATIGIGSYAFQHLKTGGGFVALKEAKPPEILRVAYSAFTNPKMLSLWLLGLTLAAALFVIGQTVRAVMAHQSIKAVEAGHKPVPVGIHPATQLGLILSAFVVPVLGLVAGVLLKLSSDDDTRAVGGTVLLVSGISLVAVGVSFLWDIAGTAMQGAAPKAK
jgi:hypothetical protein